MCLWQVVGQFDDGDLLEVHFAEIIILTEWIEFYAQCAQCPEPLGGIG